MRTLVNWLRVHTKLLLLSLRHILPASWVQWLINNLGLRHD